MKCTLSETLNSGLIYSVVLNSMTTPVSFFICSHCAEEWAKLAFNDGFKIVKSSSNLIGNFSDYASDVEIVGHSDNSATTCTLDKHELEV